MDVRPASTSGRMLTHASYTRWAAESGADRVRIDLTNVTFIDTVGLVFVAAAAQNAVLNGVDVDFTPPADRNVARYAARMHLGDCLDQMNVDSRLPSVSEDSAARLIELHRFTTESSDALADGLYRAVENNGGATRDATDFYLSVSEVLSNVTDHSGINGGSAALQVMPGDKDRNITFAVADVGHGIRRTLERRHHVPDDAASLIMAFERGVSGTSGIRGDGLPDLYERITRRAGILRTWSGGASGRSNGKKPLICAVEQVNYPGTIIYAAFKPQASEGGSR